MFLFEHIGYTLGASILVTGVTTTVRDTLSRHKISHQPEIITDDVKTVKNKIFPLTAWIDSLGKFLDIRLLILGSILPDIIDKPISMFLFGNGRIFSHTLLIFLIVLLTGIYFYIKRRATGVLAIAIGLFTHLILDQMWLDLKVLLWPLFGWSFPRGIREIYFHDWLAALISNPKIYIPETVGMVIILSFFLLLMRKKRFWAFIIHGKF